MIVGPGWNSGSDYLGRRNNNRSKVMIFYKRYSMPLNFQRGSHFILLTERQLQVRTLFKTRAKVGLQANYKFQSSSASMRPPFLNTCETFVLSVLQQNSVSGEPSKCVTK